MSWNIFTKSDHCMYYENSTARCSFCGEYCQCSEKNCPLKLNEQKHDFIVEKILKYLDNTIHLLQAGPDQRSLNAQLSDLMVLANKIKMYDAGVFLHDIISKR